VTIKFLDLHAQYLTIKPEIDAAIAEVIREAAFIGGVRNTRFEGRFAAYQQAAHCVGVANGTDAIEIGLEALDLPQGAEVIVPANSFIASSESVTRSGLLVVFADVDAATCTLDPADVERRITPKTKAIMAVHLYGHPCDMDALGELARKHGLRIIEDCAQAHGAEFRGRRVGAIGDMGTFSFYPGKNLGAYGDGGAICTNDAALAKRCRMIANHGRIDKYNHEFEGRNSRLDGLQAAILDVKLDQLDGWITKRNELARAYLEGLRGIDSLTLPAISPLVRHAFHLFVVRSPRRDALAAHLNAAGIQTGIHYPIALPKLAAYAYLGQAQEGMRANRFDGESLSLPMGEHLSRSDVERVSNVIRAWHTASR
jgi:dTDP-4-amino-4,6-dideoxygalactose transaminase